MMKATKKHCADLIRLCAGLDFFPSDSEIRGLLASTLQRCAVSDQHASRIIEHWLEFERRAPTVSDIVATARQVNPTPPLAITAVNYGCEFCSGLGFMLVIRRDGISGAARCPNQCAIPGGERLTAGPWNYMEEQKRAEMKRAAKLAAVSMNDIRGAVVSARR